MPQRILIIEDNKHIREFEKLILEKAGYEVVCASTAKQGLSLVMEEPIDLVVMDIRLPDKKRSIGAAKIIRTTEKTKHIPIVFVTAYHHGIETGEVKAISLASFIKKPFQVEHLLEEIEKYLN